MLLLELAKAGGYTNELICEAVALELSKSDPHLAVDFVCGVSDAIAQGAKNKAEALGVVADIWLSKCVATMLDDTASASRGKAVSAGATVAQVVRTSTYTFTRTLRALLELAETDAWLGVVVAAAARAVRDARGSAGDVVPLLSPL